MTKKGETHYRDYIEKRVKDFNWSRIRRRVELKSKDSGCYNDYSVLFRFRKGRFWYDSFLLVSQ